MSSPRLTSMVMVMSLVIGLHGAEAMAHRRGRFTPGEPLAMSRDPHKVGETPSPASPELAFIKKIRIADRVVSVIERKALSTFGKSTRHRRAVAGESLEWFNKYLLPAIRDAMIYGETNGLELREARLLGARAFRALRSMMRSVGSEFDVPKELLREFPGLFAEIAAPR